MFIKNKQISQLKCGLKDGVLAFALQFKNFHCPYLQKYEQDAYKSGHDLGNTDEFYKYWKRIPDEYPVGKYLLKYCIEKEYIVPVGWDMQSDQFGFPRVNILTDEFDHIKKHPTQKNNILFEPTLGKSSQK